MHFARFSASTCFEYIFLNVYYFLYIFLYMHQPLTQCLFYLYRHGMSRANATRLRSIFYPTAGFMLPKQPLFNSEFLDPIRYDACIHICIHTCIQGPRMYFISLEFQRAGSRPAATQPMSGAGTRKGNVNESTKTPCGCGVFRLSAALLLSVSGRAGAERLFLFHPDQFDRFFACHVLDCDLNKTNLLKAFVNFP